MVGLEKGTLQKPETFSVKWKIDQFFADGLNVGDYYTSPVFSIQYANKTTKWHLRVYPNGEKEQNKDYVSLYLFFSSKNEIKVTVDYRLSIVSQYNISKNKVAHVFESPSSNWGWSKFEQHSFVRNTKNGALINGTLTILCEIIFCPSDQNNAEKGHGYDEWLEKIGIGVGDCEPLLESGTFSDVVFNVQDVKIKCHKAILSCRSPVFQAMFEHEMKEKKQSVVDIADIDSAVMKELFRFIYSGKVKNIVEIASELLIAADKYQVIELKALCEKTLYDGLTVDNAVEYLILTDICDTIHLKRLVMKFVSAHSKVVMKKPGFKDLNNSVMYEVMQAIVAKD